MAQPRVAVIGLGSMGLGMARSLQRAGMPVTGTDISPERRHAFSLDGGEVAEGAAAAAAGAAFVICVVITGAQTEAVLFEDGVAAAMAPGATFISCATMAPAQARALGRRAMDAGCGYLDAPISGGARGAEAGSLSIMASGARTTYDAALPVLQAMGQRLFWLGEEPGLGSAMKTVNQLLAGANLATACEAITFAIRLGLDPRTVDEIISGSAGGSWMWADRISPLIAGDYTPRSVVDIFTKDLGIVMDTARASNFPVPMGGTALQSFLMAAASGMGREADAAVAKVYAQLAGLALPTPADD